MKMPMNDTENISDLSRQKSEIDSRIRRAYRGIVRTLGRTEFDEGSLYRAHVQELVELTDARHVDNWMVGRLDKRGISVDSFASFRSLLAAKRAFGSYMRDPLADAANNKRNAYKAADLMSLRRPHTIASGLRLSEVVRNFQPSVVKPVSSAGSRGVYWIFDSANIIYVKSGERLSSPGELESHARRLLRGGVLGDDLWFMEELIRRPGSRFEAPAHDLKFYSFYGDIKFILEINRFPEYESDFYGGDGRRLSEAPFTAWSGSRMQGHGVSGQDLELIQEVSRSIPLPFLRIDMLKSPDGLVFCEFTPSPGAASSFKPSWDIQLGMAYLRAEQRLRLDLLCGKAFPEHWRLIANDGETESRPQA